MAMFMVFFIGIFIIQIEKKRDNKAYFGKVYSIDKCMTVYNDTLEVNYTVPWIKLCYCRFGTKPK